MYKKEIFLEIDANLHQPIQSMEADSNSRAIRFYLTSNYAPLNLKDKKVIFKAVKPDSTDIVNDCEIIDVEKGIVETKVTKQLNAVPGRVNCQLSIIGANDYVLKTKKFVILVDSKLTESGIISSREYKTLENALSEVHEINKNFEQVNAKINEVATKGTTVEVIEEVTKEEIERQIADGTITHLMIEDGSVTPEKTSFYDEIATQKKLLKNAEFDYMGNNQNTVKKAIDSSIDWVLGEVNTAHHEGQHITATDTIEGHAKSAILNGLTLVNLSENLETITRSTGWWYLEEKLIDNIEKLKRNTYYTVLYRLENLSGNHERFDGIGLGIGPNVFEKDLPDGISTLDKNGGWCKIRFQLTDDFIEQNPTYKQLYIRPIRRSTAPVEGESVDYTIRGFAILEGDYITNPIPFNKVFEGMQSVKMPVLTTVGKNLFDLDEFIKQTNALLIGDEITLNKNSSNKKYYVNIPYNNTTFSCEVVHSIKSPSIVMRYFFKDGTYIGEAFYNVGLIERHFTKQLDYIQIDNWGGIGTIIKNIQIEQGTVATSYEPFKSNILTVNEEVELRGIGEVKDELDCLTGELTQRVGEIVLNGSDIAHTNNNNYMTEISTAILTSVFSNCIIRQSIMCKDFPVYMAYEGIWEKGKGIVSGVSFVSDTWGFCIRLPHTLTGVTTVDSEDTVKQKFKAYLQSNPITVQYQLATESIKTVDLSDNVVYSYDEVTHYDCSSEEGSLVPTLSVDVPTNLSALVSRQRATIETQKEQIQSLEVENEQLIAQNEIQDEDIALNQDAINFMLFTSEMLADDDNKTKGVNTMAAYLANQILKGKLDYSLVVSRYPQFKEDIDTILILEGEENLIK